MTVPPEGPKRPGKPDVGEYRDDKTMDIPRVIAIGLVLGLSACTNPYDPVQRTIGGGLIGAGSGAAIGAAAAGGHGAALGPAAVGSAASAAPTNTPSGY